MLNGLDLFSGIGGISLALREWVRPIAYCEIDPYCQGVLLSRMDSNELPRAKIWDDVITLTNIWFPNAIVDILTGGFPCQDISIAGVGKGLEGKRSGLFFEIVRLAKEIQPKFIFLENVPAITSRGGLQVVREIAEMGYDCRWCVISAASIGALHRRERWFLLAYAHVAECGREFRKLSKENERIGQSKECRKDNTFKSSNGCQNVANARCQCACSENQSEWTSFHTPGCHRFWEIEPDVGRVADGIQQRVDRLKALGNAVVPEQAKEAFKILMGLK